LKAFENVVIVSLTLLGLLFCPLYGLSVELLCGGPLRGCLPPDDRVGGGPLLLSGGPPPLRLPFSRTPPFAYVGAYFATISF
jgi:hypothetical protein